MLNRMALATSLAILSGFIYVLFYVLAVVWRDGFRFVFNAQFFGADVASLLPIAGGRRRDIEHASTPASSASPTP